MKKTRDNLKILLLQIREDSATSAEEYQEFCEFGGLKNSQVDILNTYITPEFGVDVLNGYDALFVGGSSDASVLDVIKYPFVIDCYKLLRHCYLNDIPVFASCFGFQVVVMEMGGKVILDHENMEMGIYQIQLTDAARDDPLLYDFPTSFWAVSGHKERASIIPAHTTVLGYTKLCPYHIIHFDDKPFYAFQFHPELSRDLFRQRITRYHNRYFKNREDFEKMLAVTTQSTEIANSMVAKFVDRILLA